MSIRTILGLCMVGLCACADIGGDEVMLAEQEENVGAFGNDHGYVAVTVDAETTVDLGPTRSIELRLYYGGCFADFYRHNPQWRLDGDDGAAVFDSALETDLCTTDTFDRVACSVESIRQDLDGGDEKLLIAYDINELEAGQDLRIGPLPTPALAGCDSTGGVGAGQLSAWGLDASGGLLWSADVPHLSAEQYGVPVMSATAPD